MKKILVILLSIISIIALAEHVPVVHVHTHENVKSTHEMKSTKIMNDQTGHYTMNNDKVKSISMNENNSAFKSVNPDTYGKIEDTNKSSAYPIGKGGAKMPY